MTLPDQPPGALPATSSRRRPRKSLGQHFLIDPRIAQRIVAAAQPSPGDTILEIGPGSGTLTRRLIASGSNVIAVEIDPHLAAGLPERMDNPPNLKVVRGDARTVDIPALLEGRSAYKLVANLPYYAAAPILRRFLESQIPPTSLIVMVQREVADAMCAAPGQMTLMSVATQLYAVPSVVAQVPPRSFRPPPKVSSTVVKLVMRETQPDPSNGIEEFFALVRSGFSAPRKQLRNSLMQGSGSPAEFVSNVLTDAGIDGQRRPATLSIPEWLTLDTHWPAGVPRRRSQHNNGDVNGTHAQGSR
jgi:16S rRNA (adenine1518-N6/adenine1519-N6)-dimethyltransferase